MCIYVKVKDGVSVGSRSFPSTGPCCVISTVAYHYTVAVSILILLMDGSDLHMRENWRGQTEEDPDRYQGFLYSFFIFLLFFIVNY
jgi:hypothetical protein